MGDVAQKTKNSEDCLTKQYQGDDPKGFSFMLNHNGEILNTVDSFSIVMQMQVKRNVILVG